MKSWEQVKEELDRRIAEGLDPEFSYFSLRGKAAAWFAKGMGVGDMESWGNETYRGCPIELSYDGPEEIVAVNGLPF